MATEDGYKRIDEIETGDLVWAYNVETGELELKEVLTVYVKENKEILHLETSIGNIDTTTNHPFYVIGEGWVAAGDLVVGDKVYALDGSVSVITGYWLEVFDAPVMVYNLEVEGFHTYFVGEFGVLVHNNYSNNRVLNDTKIKGYTVSMDLEKGGSGINNIHLKVDNTKYFYEDGKFINKAGKELPNSLRNNTTIQNASKKALKLMGEVGNFEFFK